MGISYPAMGKEIPQWSYGLITIPLGLAIHHAKWPLASPCSCDLGWDATSVSMAEWLGPLKAIPNRNISYSS